MIIAIEGGTQAGKTTLANALADQIEGASVSSDYMEYISDKDHFYTLTPCDRNRRLMDIERSRHKNIVASRSVPAIHLLDRCYLSILSYEYVFGRASVDNYPSWLDTSAVTKPDLIIFLGLNDLQREERYVSRGDKLHTQARRAFKDSSFNQAIEQFFRDQPFHPVVFLESSRLEEKKIVELALSELLKHSAGKNVPKIVQKPSP